jgi:Lamin Tail Domain
MSLRSFSLAIIFSAAIAIGGTSHAATIAITEFIIDPFGADDVAPEWVELYNYGPDSTDISGWTLKDNSSAIYTFPASFTIPSGGYVIASSNRANFITNWLGGVDDARVASNAFTFALNNTNPGDGIYLRDASANLVWSVGYQVASTTGGDTTAASQYRATFLAVNDFSQNNFGQPPQAGAALINRNGTDATAIPTLGYEDNNRTADPKMYASSNGTGQQMGSPLQGNYTVVPEPSAILLVLSALSGIFALPRRR